MAVREQLRLASEQEVVTELLQKGEAVVKPVQDVLKNLNRFVDVAKEGDPFGEDGPSTSEMALPEKPWDDGAPDPEPSRSQAQTSEDWENTLQNAADEWSRRTATPTGPPRRPSRSRSAERQGARQTVKEQVTRWQQIASANAARKLEGLPPQLRMPESIRTREVETDTWELDAENRMLIRHHLRPLVWHPAL